jgi:hypothetical protein
MSPVRRAIQDPVITKLLREHDRLPHDKVSERKKNILEGRILFSDDHHQNGRVFQILLLEASDSFL